MCTGAWARGTHRRACRRRGGHKGCVEGRGRERVEASDVDEGRTRLGKSVGRRVVERVGGSLGRRMGERAGRVRWGSGQLGE